MTSAKSFAILTEKGDDSTKEAILKKLEEIERERNIKILYAVESGSRAWGFASEDSDYDVRYIFIRRTEDYLRVDELRDTIEGPLDDVMDFSGWDVRKTLELLRRCNPSLMEWYQSPIVYKTTPLWEKLAEKIPGYFLVRANMHHYLSMAMGNWNGHLKLSLEQVSVKKYLYALRPILCSRWLETYGTVPPVLFSTLYEKVLPEDMTDTVRDLLELKKTVNEKTLIPRIPKLDEFLQAEIARLLQVRDNLPKYTLPDYEDVNALFRQLLKEAWMISDC